MIEIVKYGASWCGPYRAMDAMLTRLKEEYPDVPIWSVDVESPEGEKARKDYKIFAIPTTLGFVDGKVASRTIGVSTYEALKGVITNLQAIEAEKAASTSNHE